MSNVFGPLGTIRTTHCFWSGSALRSAIDQDTNNDLIRAIGQASVVGALAPPECLI